jgi:hypothetical protein
MIWFLSQHFVHCCCSTTIWSMMIKSTCSRWILKKYKRKINRSGQQHQCNYVQIFTWTIYIQFFSMYHSTNVTSKHKLKWLVNAKHLENLIPLNLISGCKMVLNNYQHYRVVKVVKSSFAKNILLKLWKQLVNLNNYKQYIKKKTYMRCMV